MLNQDQPMVESKDTLSEIEILYLQFSFDEMPSDPIDKLQGVTVASAGTQLTVIPSLKDKLEQGLLFVADHLLNCYSPDVSTCLTRLCVHVYV